MSDALTLPAETRERAGKGASRALRREGRVPAVVYGGNEEPLTIHVEEKELRRQLGTGHFMNSIVMIDARGQDASAPCPRMWLSTRSPTVRCMSISCACRRTRKIQVAVPVVFINEEASPGLKKGGVLNIVRHELELVCESDKIPDEIEIDVTGYDVGDSIHISARDAARWFGKRDHRSRLHHRHDRRPVSAQAR